MPLQTTAPELLSPLPDMNTERRASIRYLCNLETACQPIAEAIAESWPARAVDVSSGGAALVVFRRFEPGAILTVRLESPDGEVSRTMLMRVVHAAPELDGSWRLGCALAGELREEELQAFQAESKRPAEGDSRAWVRFACDVEAPCRAVAPAQPGLWSARILDVSPGGMSLLVPRHFERGSLLSIDLPYSAGAPSRSVLVRVLRDRPLGSHMRILGCELADKLSDEDLQRFHQ